MFVGVFVGVFVGSARPDPAVIARILTSDTMFVSVFVGVLGVAPPDLLLAAQNIRKE